MVMGMFAVALFVLGVRATCAQMLVGEGLGACGDVEMVQNGNFSVPKIESPWTVLGVIAGGWSTIPPSNGFELWKQGAMESPSVDALGKPTGQNLEINGNNAWAQITYDMLLPCLMGSTEAVFSFEYWFRPEWTVNSFSVSVEQQSKQIFDQNYPQNTQQWTSITESFEVQGCQPLKLVFTCDAESSGGVHLDNVSLKIKGCQDVEMVTGGSFEETSITKTWQEVESLESGTGIWTASSSAAPTASFYLWKQGAIGIPSTSSTGQPTGQTLEINAKSTKAKVGYGFFVPFMLGSAETSLSFEYFFQASTIVNFFGMSIEQGGVVVASKTLHEGDGCASSNPTSWQKVSHSVTLKPALPVYVYFQTDTATEGGVHIDSVSVLTSESRDQDTAVLAPGFMVAL